MKFTAKHDNFLTRVIVTPGLWVQRMTTKEPDDQMIEVAIAALKAILPFDEELKPSESKEPQIVQENTADPEILEEDDGEAEITATETTDRGEPNDGQ